MPPPTTAGDAVADLHALLSAAGEAKPYVLAGHSYGGLIVRLYASTYPEDVSGLVLVDALSEGIQDAETPEQWAIQRKLIEAFRAAQFAPHNFALFGLHTSYLLARFVNWCILLMSGLGHFGVCVRVVACLKI